MAASPSAPMPCWPLSVKAIARATLFFQLANPLIHRGFTDIHCRSSGGYVNSRCFPGLSLLFLLSYVLLLKFNIENKKRTRMKFGNNLSTMLTIDEIKVTSRKVGVFVSHRREFTSHDIM